jgi:hypothetical protein
VYLDQPGGSAAVSTPSEFLAGIADLARGLNMGFDIQATSAKLVIVRYQQLWSYMGIMNTKIFVEALDDQGGLLSRGASVQLGLA